MSSFTRFITDLANAVTGTLAVTNGGTGDTGTAWTTYTPTITANVGTFTTVTGAGRYKDLGKTRFIQITITCTTKNTGSTSANVPLPNGTTASRAVVYAADVSTGAPGDAGTAQIASGASAFTFAPAGLAFTDGHIYVVSGTIEMA